MDEEILYPVCPHRNVPAAFQRFLGPDSGGIERFFPEEQGYRLDDTVWEVRVKLHRAGRVIHDGYVLAAAIVTVASSVLAGSAQACLFRLKAQVV